MQKKTTQKNELPWAVKEYIFRREQFLFQGYFFLEVK